MMFSIYFQQQTFSDQYRLNDQKLHYPKKHRSMLRSLDADVLTQSWVLISEKHCVETSE